MCSTELPGPPPGLRGRGASETAASLPSGSSAPRSSKTSAPLHSKAQPWPGWVVILRAAHQSIASAAGHAGSWVHVMVSYIRVSSVRPGGRWFARARPIGISLPVSGFARPCQARRTRCPRRVSDIRPRGAVASPGRARFTRPRQMARSGQAHTLSTSSHGTAARGASALSEEVARSQRANEGTRSNHSPPLSLYSAPGGLRQDPGRAA
jgi:hypothetical protein